MPYNIEGNKPHPQNPCFSKDINFWSIKPNKHLCEM